MKGLTLDAIALKTEAETVAEKLFICLHGWGANAQDVAALAEYMPLSGYHLRFPNGPFPHPYNPVGRMWYGLPEEYDFRPQPDVEQPVDLQESRQRLKAWIATVVQETGVPLERTLLAGFSQGGAMALDVGLQLPFAGVVILSGYLHSPPMPHHSIGPILMVHGRHDQVVPIEVAREVQTTLEALPLDLTYQEFEMGHEISPQALQQIVAFCEEIENRS